MKSGLRVKDMHNMGKREEEALTILFSNLKGNRKKIHDWITIAENMNYLVQLYGSTTAVSKKLSIANSMVNSIIKLLKLTKKNKQLVRERKILQDTGEKLAGLEDINLQNMVGDLVIGLSNYDARELIDYAKKYPKSSLKDLEEFKNRINKSKSSKEKLFVTIVPFDEEHFFMLKKEASKRNVSLEELSKRIIKEWIERDKK